MLSFCTQVTHLFHIMQSGSCKIFFLCFVQLFRLQSQSRKWRCQSTIRKVGTPYKYRYKYCMIKALLTIRELHTVCPWSEFQSQLSCSHKFIISEEAMSLSVFPHCITIALFCVVVMVSAHLCVVCRHFCHPMSLFQGHVLVRILPEQSSIQTTSSPPFFLRGDFHARSRFARSTIPEKKWGTTRSLGPIIIWIIDNKRNLFAVTSIQFSVLSIALYVFLYIEIACFNLIRHPLYF